MNLILQQGRVSCFRYSLMRNYSTLARPGVKFFCDVPYDPFKFMEDNDKVYGEYNLYCLIWMVFNILSGFTISLVEWEATIPTLWQAVKGLFKACRTLTRSLPWTIDFIFDNFQYISPNNSMAFLSNNGGESYNLCHCRYFFTAFFFVLTEQIGVISRLPIWISGAEKLTRGFLTS